MTRSEKGRHRERHDPHWIEWLTGAVSALLIAAMLLLSIAVDQTSAWLRRCMQ